ncbi:hypothetical protein EN871_32855, partial [bacterium M00.F.Ca.ET.228.01.1.1]
MIVELAALAARSVALAGFGLDSLIEIFASVVVVWHLTGAGDNKEKFALRMIGAAFIALAVYILIQTIYVLTTGGRPAPLPAGIVWLTATVIAMLALARGKLVTGRRLDNAVLIAESRVTVVDAYLAACQRHSGIDTASAGIGTSDLIHRVVVLSRCQPHSVGGVLLCHS